MFRKNCVFFIIHCNPSIAYISLQEICKAPNAMRVNSGQFLYNSSPVLARERWQNNENSWKNTFFLNTLYAFVCNGHIINKNINFSINILGFKWWFFSIPLIAFRGRRQRKQVIFYGISSWFQYYAYKINILCQICPE